MLCMLAVSDIIMLQRNAEFHILDILHPLHSLSHTHTTHYYLLTAAAQARYYRYYSH